MLRTNSKEVKKRVQEHIIEAVIYNEADTIENGLTELAEYLTTFKTYNNINSHYEAMEHMTSGLSMGFYHKNSNSGLIELVNSWTENTKEYDIYDVLKLYDSLVAREVITLFKLYNIEYNQF